MDTDIKSKRGGWGSNFGFLMASIGSAVGLGNIWGFPYKMGKSGGAVFLLFYLVLVVLVGVTVMLGELALGRRSGKSGVSTYRALSKKYTWLGYAGVLCGFASCASTSCSAASCCATRWATSSRSSAGARLHGPVRARTSSAIFSRTPRA